MRYPYQSMLGRLSLTLLLGLLAACATSVKGDGGGERVDASPINFAIDAAVPDPIATDAMQPPPTPDAATSTISATVTADCLFLRAGAGTGNAKVPCTDSGAWCNAENDVCMPMGDEVTVTGPGLQGAGCTADWYPVDYRIYEGFACGSFLQFSTAAAFLPDDHITEFPTVADGPQG